MDKFTSLRCKKCNGKLDGELEGTEDKHCDCWKLETMEVGTGNTEPIIGLVGWTCPVCGRGLSPFTSICPCIPFEIKVNC